MNLITKVPVKLNTKQAHIIQCYYLESWDDKDLLHDVWCLKTWMAELIWIKDFNAAAVCAIQRYPLKSETGGSHCDSMVLDYTRCWIPNQQLQLDDAENFVLSLVRDNSNQCSLPEIRDGQNLAPEVGRERDRSIEPVAVFAWMVAVM